MLDNLENIIRKRYHSFKIYIFLFFLIECLTGLFSNELPAILSSGPHEISGIDILGPNIIRAFKGEYTAGTFAISVIFTRAQVIVSQKQTKTTKCNKGNIFRHTGVLDDNTKVFFYKDPDGFILFFNFPDEFSRWCSFMEMFIDKFKYFLEFTQNENDIPFPAVVYFEF